MKSSTGDRSRVRIIGIPIDVVSLEEARARVTTHWDSQQGASEAHPFHIVTVNPQHVMVAQKDDRLMRVIERCDLSVADGIGIVWAAKNLGTPLPERVPGIELGELLLEEAARRKKKVFLFGGEEGVASEAAKALTDRLPGLNIVGALSGFFPPSHDGDIVNEIAAHGVDLLLVGLGVPKQEYWIASYKDTLKAKVVVGVGGALDVFSGQVRRAPLFWRKIHMEWMYRAISQPGRIRRLQILPQFVTEVYKVRRGRSRGKEESTCKNE